MLLNRYRNMLYVSVSRCKQGKLSPGCRKAAGDCFILHPCQAKLWREAYGLLQACCFVSPTSPPLCFGKKWSFQLGRACAVPNTPPNFHWESRNLHTNVLKLGSSVLWRLGIKKPMVSIEKILRFPPKISLFLAHKPIVHLQLFVAGTSLSVRLVMEIQEVFEGGFEADLDGANRVPLLSPKARGQVHGRCVPPAGSTGVAFSQIPQDFPREFALDLSMEGKIHEPNKETQKPVSRLSSAHPAGPTDAPLCLHIPHLLPRIQLFICSYSPCARRSPGLSPLSLPLIHII